MLNYSKFNFTYKNYSNKNKARLGILSTPNGKINTPAFVFCATKAGIKGVTTKILKELNTQIILGNNYHLIINPGTKLIANLGGLHNFMNWDGPLMTDSGGYQVFSMVHKSISDDIKGTKTNQNNFIISKSSTNITFKSYLDGSIIELTPQKATLAQIDLGANLIFQFDECTSIQDTKEYTKKSMENSLLWGEISLDTLAKSNSNQAMYGISQGGIYKDFRITSCQKINDMNFFGNAIGGSLGSTKESMKEIIELCCNEFNLDKPIHLLGIGQIADIFLGVKNGIDTFDCVIPTRLARHGVAIMPKQNINLLNHKWKYDNSPLQAEGPCEVSKTHSKAYLHYLFKIKSSLGGQLLTMHNIAQMNYLMQEIRTFILNDELDYLEKLWLS